MKTKNLIQYKVFLRGLLAFACLFFTLFVSCHSGRFLKENDLGRRAVTHRDTVFFDKDCIVYLDIEYPPLCPFFAGLEITLDSIYGVSRNGIVSGDTILIFSNDSVLFPNDKALSKAEVYAQNQKYFDGRIEESLADGPFKLSFSDSTWDNKAVFHSWSDSIDNVIEKYDQKGNSFYVYDDSIDDPDQYFLTECIMRNPCTYYMWDVIVNRINELGITAFVTSKSCLKHVWICYTSPSEVQRNGYLYILATIEQGLVKEIYLSDNSIGVRHIPERWGI